jgi:bifunctional N-acetylglucosamine-1-phosphate-uridyltransferase/glucosamine-1-phosphate-acetyltransferase GlmU-like protein
MRSISRNGRGEPCPKQYCAFVGSRAMLQHTLDRAKQLVPSDQIVTVIGKGHRRHIEDRSSLPGRLVEQPASRDTAAGLFFALACITALDPNAMVLVLPSDHFVSPESAFVRNLDLLLDIGICLCVLVGCLTDPLGCRACRRSTGDLLRGHVPSNVRETVSASSRPGSRRAGWIHAPRM